MDFSVIIPTYGREEQLAGCLEALSRQDFPKESFEVLVVDDGSPAPPEDVVEKMRATMCVRLLRQPHRGPASTRNAGADAARGRYLAFTDDDCRPDPAWLRALDARFREDPNCVIGGRTVNALTENVYSTASQLLIDYLYSYYNAGHASARMLTSNNLAIPAELFRGVGGFDVNFPVAAAEDRELCDRLHYLGHRLTYAPEVVVNHRHALSLRRFWRQHFNYGTGACRYYRIRATRTDEGIFIEPTLYYWKLLLYPVHAGASRALSLTVLFALSQVANAAGFLRQKLAFIVDGSS